MFSIESIRNAKVESLDGVGESYGYFETVESSYKNNVDSRIEEFTDPNWVFGRTRAALDAYDEGDNFNILIGGTEFEAVEVEGDTLAIFLDDGIKLFSIVSN